MYNIFGAAIVFGANFSCRLSHTTALDHARSRIGGPMKYLRRVLLVVNSSSKFEKKLI